MAATVPDTELGLTEDEILLLRHHQQQAANSSSSRAASRASSQGLLLLDGSSLAALGRHFDRLMEQIQQRLDYLSEQSQMVVQQQYDTAGNAIAIADAEIARFHEILRQIDELEVDFDRIRHIRDIVRAYRQRVEEMEQQLEHSGSDASQHLKDQTKLKLLPRSKMDITMADTTEELRDAQMNAPADSVEVDSQSALSQVDDSNKEVSTTPQHPVVTADPPAASTSSPLFFKAGRPTGFTSSGRPLSNNDPDFKFKYPEARPTPPDEDDYEWNKTYTAADSRFYNKYKKNSNESKRLRQTGETRILAIQMHEEKNKAAAARAAGGIGNPGSKASAAKPKPPVAKLQISTNIKNEASASSRDPTPGADKIQLSISEQIKSAGRAAKAASATASSDRGTPAPMAAPKLNSPAPTAPKVEKSTPKKKGTAAPVKKVKKISQTEKSVNTPANSVRASQTPGPKTANTSEDDSNDGGEYCICRGPDDHRMMVYCEGGCDDWYHCSCIDIDVEDAKELLDRFICPKCKSETSFTTWKRMCRYYNVDGCRKAARVTQDPPSKYCSDEHKKMFWEFVRSKVRDDDKPSMGGALNRGEVADILHQCPTAAEIHALGTKPRLPLKEGADPDRPAGLDHLTAEEEKEIEAIKEKRKVIDRRIEGYRSQLKLLHMINKRAAIAGQQPNLEVKEICGYDNRLAMNEAQFAIWSTTSEGITALSTGILGPRTEESKPIGAQIPYPGQVIPEVPKVADELDNICLKSKKKCRHNGWHDIHNEEYYFSINNLKKESRKLEKKEAGIIDDAETREATKEYDAENITIQLF
ncbi:hypothetical protein B7494_g5713 [Chlorociboria aeruginascens]|nr:hypothetical protein B7494_g5713 [Chlorociboria aeruginascens]